MIQPYDFAVLALATGRVASSIAGDEIFRPVRNWVYLRSAPVDDQIVTYTGEGDAYDPARFAQLESDRWSIRDTWHVDSGQLRTPGFLGRLVSCPVCVSFWVSLFWLALHVASAHWAIILALPFAVWALAVAFIHYTS